MDNIIMPCVKKDESRCSSLLGLMKNKLSQAGKQWADVERNNKKRFQREAASIGMAKTRASKENKIVNIEGIYK